MNKEFVPYEIALKLKELGFNDECFGFYSSDGIFHINGTIFCPPYSCDAPLFQQAFQWFREKHNLSAEIQTPDMGGKGMWLPGIHKINGWGNYFDNNGFDSYKEAELECLKELINFFREK